jgi:hypothetical protein
MVPETKKKITRDRNKKPEVHRTPSLAIRSTEWRWRMDAISRCTMDELRKVVADKNTDAADLMICQIVINAIKTGDQKRLEFILDRTIGKVKDTLEVIQPTPTVIRRKNGEEVELGTVLKREEDDESEL